MRCSSCGLPLSPTRTQCPRCGTTAGSGKKEERSDNQLGTPQQAFPVNNMPMGTELQQPQWVAQDGSQGQGQGEMLFTPVPAQQPIHNEMQNQMAPALIGQSFDQTNMPRLSTPDSLYHNDQTLLSSPSNIYPHLSGAGSGTTSPQYPRHSQQLAPKRASSSTRPGLTVASLCVLTGGFILILVYILSLHLPPVSVASQTISATATAQAVVPVQTPVSSPPMTPQPTPIPTQTLPGQQFVDTVQMASSVNVNTAQPLQPTTNFRVSQQIFVTFMLHPSPNGGAVCLSWYINQTQFSHFAFQAGATPESAYSFAYAGSPGQGSVQISWASSVACTDKMLARISTFTVS